MMRGMEDVLNGLYDIWCIKYVWAYFLRYASKYLTTDCAGENRPLMPKHAATGELVSLQRSSHRIQ